MPNKIIKHKDGSEYSGKVDEKSNRHGRGKLTLANGEKYVGEWKNDKKDGRGVYYSADGSILRRGFWRDDIFLQKSEYFKIKDQKKLREKFSKLLQEYSDQESEANYPYSDRYADYPEKHPFEDAPTELMDDEEFLLNCLETDYAQCFKFASERLRNKKDFVLESLKYAYPEHEHIGEDLKHDFDIIIKTKLKDFSKFGDVILNDKNKLSKIIKPSNSKDFTSYENLPAHIRSDKTFFLNLLNSPNGERCLLWASDKLKSDKILIEKFVKKSPESIKYINKNVPSYSKLVLKAVSKKGELLRVVDRRFLKIKSYVLRAAKTYGEIIKYIDKKLRKDRQIALVCILKDPTMLKYVDQKLKKDKKLIIKLIKKDFSSYKYIDKKLKSNLQILKNVILNLEFGSGDEYNSAAPYISKLGNRNLIKFALKKSGFWLDKLSNKYKDDKELALIAINNYQGHFSDVSERLKKDKDILEAAAKNYLKGFKNSKTKKIEYNDINNIDDVSTHLLHTDLYWYIFYKVNPHKKNNKIEYVESKRIWGEGVFDTYDKVYYSGEIMNARAHGKGYATNEESEWGDATFVITYNGVWKEGLPDGKGDYKSYAANHYPPDGKVESHYIGEFSKGKQHGKGKVYNEDGKPKWKKVEYINGKIKN